MQSQEKNKVVNVYLKEQLVGTVFWDTPSNSTVFQYAGEFVKTGIELSPIIMPLGIEPYYSRPRVAETTFKNLPPMLADSLPDSHGNAMLNSFLQRKNIDISRLNPLDRLCYMADRGMGALEFEPKLFDFNLGDTKINIKELTDLVEQIHNQKEEKTASLDEENKLATLLRIGTSAGGARAKAVIAINNQTNEVKAGDIIQPKGFDYFLIKFDNPITNDKELYKKTSHWGIMEYTYHQLVKMAGINMTDCSLLKDGERSHFLTQRFDRNNEGEKYHIQTVCGLTGLDFNERALDYKNLFDITIALTQNKSKLACIELYKRMIFNYVGMNNDDHLKNFSFMMKNDEWQLTPMYDVVFQHDPKNQYINKHYTSVNGKFEGVTYHDLIETGEKAGVKNAEELLNDTIEIFKEFPYLAEKNGLPQSKIDFFQEQLEENEITKYHKQHIERKGGSLKI